MKKLTRKQAGKVILRILRDRKMKENNKDFEKFIKNKLFICPFCSKRFKTDEKKFRSVIKEYKKSGEMHNEYYPCDKCSKIHEINRYDYDKCKMTEKQIEILFSTFLEEYNRLEEKLGKFVPLEELEKACAESTKNRGKDSQITPDEIGFATDSLVAQGEFFIPRKGFVQKV